MRAFGALYGLNPDPLQLSLIPVRAAFADREKNRSVVVALATVVAGLVAAARVEVAAVVMATMAVVLVSSLTPQCSSIGYGGSVMFVSPVHSLNDVAFLSKSLCSYIFSSFCCQE